MNTFEVAESKKNTSQKKGIFVERWSNQKLGQLKLQLKLIIQAEDVYCYTWLLMKWLIFPSSPKLQVKDDEQRLLWESGNPASP